jgi:hypothetical protein
MRVNSPKIVSVGQYLSFASCRAVRPEAEAISRHIVYNFTMARGWESKSVEQQIEDAQTDPNRSPASGGELEEIELRRRREGLLLQRARVLQEIEQARNPRYRELLNAMLHHLETQLSSQ